MLLKCYHFFKNRATDTNRLNNRGGALLKEEKTRKAVEKELPKVSLYEVYQYFSSLVTLSIYIYICVHTPNHEYI